MAPLPLNHPLVLIFGILGNFISCVVYLSPVPTFYRIYWKKSTEGFQSVPYVVALFSAMLWIFYALVKSNEGLLISINSFGCLIETVYIVMYLVYAPKSAKIFTVKILLVLNVGVFALILLLTLLLSKGSDRVHILGWVCVGFSVSVFAAPLSIIRLVIRTKSVEFMPFSLSFSLTLSAVVWFGYGLLTKDKYVAIPNILGFLFGIMQMVLYIAYKNKRPMIEEYKLPEQVVEIVKLSVTAERGSEVHPIDLKPQHACGEGPEAGGGRKEYEQAVDDSSSGDGGSGEKDIEALEKGEMGHVEV
ncbi:bidirectional sugar transporter SWEET14-like [Ananas comosus]|uniref:Bidirectional sugar transporter SWEET n=1 Tax=Ananas comosus TaxID=4615 RepID=A0A6P5GTM6_ANACO|nr:bidirectional sugar transporter SWEET14-like [Ananas comosus]